MGSVRNRAAENFDIAVDELRRHPLFADFGVERRVKRVALGRNSWSKFERELVACDTRLAEPAAWLWVLAHQFTHLGLGHLSTERLYLEHGSVHPWFNAAACVEVNSLLAHLRIGRCPLDLPELPPGDSNDLFRRWRERPPGHSPDVWSVAAAGDLGAGFVWRRPWSNASWEEVFAHGLQRAVTAAVNVAGGRAESLSGRSPVKSRWRTARDWFIASYPLLGGVAAGLTLIEDAEVCAQHNISLAAVNVMAGELIVNPHRTLTAAECRFVIAHEILHAALRHDLRADQRDPFLWNVACDYVINGWLVEMELGSPPEGVLLDDDIKGWSAEEVYPRITRDLRRRRKLATLAGTGVGDVATHSPGVANAARHTDLDAFYRRALANGLSYHRDAGRGLLPAGLVEEIRARTEPAIDWQVELARWFDERFPPLEAARSFARLSRRQAATPEIPRPALVRPPEAADRTFGVVLDTSGSMDHALLGKALGAIASYSLARQVRRARVVFCDAAAHDAGWLAPEEISGRVTVKGRGGTVLQPGIDLLQGASDFPKKGPILIITDGDCDTLRVRRDHAYLLPRGQRLPFSAQGPVFRLT